MLTPSDLAAMRSAAQRGLASVCNVVTVTTVRDARGNVTETTVTGPDFACHVAPISADREGEVLAQVRSLNAYRILYPTSTVLGTRDRVMVDVEGTTRLLEVVIGSPPQTYRALGSAVAVEAPA